MLLSSITVWGLLLRRKGHRRSEFRKAELIPRRLYVIGRVHPLPFAPTWEGFPTPEEKAGITEGGSLNFVADLAASRPGNIANGYLIIVESNSALLA